MRVMRAHILREVMANILFVMRAHILRVVRAHILRKIDPLFVAYGKRSGIRFQYRKHAIINP